MNKIIKSHDPKKCKNWKWLIVFELNKELLRDWKVLKNYSFWVMKKKEIIWKLESLKEIYSERMESWKSNADKIEYIEWIELRLINTSNKRKERNEIRYYFKEV